MRRSRGLQPRREDVPRGGQNNRSPTPNSASDPFFSAVQAEQAELVIQAGVHKEKSLQFYFLDDRHKMVAESINQAMIASKIRRIFKEKRRQIGGGERSQNRNGVQVDETYVSKDAIRGGHKHTDYERSDYVLGFFPKIQFKRLKIDPNQNFSEWVLKIEDESRNDLAVLLQSALRGRIYVHRSGHMEFPDPDPIIIQGELKHYIICEVNEMEVIPHKLLMMRKEMYQILGDYYDLSEGQRSQIQMVTVSYEEYFKKLDVLEGRIQKRQQQVIMQVEDSMSEDMWRVLEADKETKERQKLQEELKAQQQMLQQVPRQQEGQRTQQKPTQNTAVQQRIKLREPTLTQEELSGYNPNDISVGEAQLSNDNRQQILYKDTSLDQDGWINS